MKTFRALLIPVLAIAALVVSSTAEAMTPARMTLLKERGHLAIERRLNELDRLTGLVNDARHLISGDRSTLLSKLSSDRSGLESLDAKIQNDSDGPTLTSDLASIVTAYRIYVLVVPQVHITVAADRIDAFIALGNRVAAKIQDAIDKAKGAGKNVSGAQSALKDMKKELAAAKAAIAGVVPSVTALTPSDYPGNRSVLLSARDKLVAARGDLLRARQDAHTAAAALT